MDIDHTRVYRIILNHLPWSKKPNLAILRSFTDYLPDAVILGFGYYDHYKLWYLLAYSPTFPQNLWGSSGNLTWHQATGAKALTMTSGWEPTKL